jgi:hypothetical protein
MSAIAAGLLVAVMGVEAGVTVLKSNAYGAWLFVVTPFVMGFVVALLYNRRHPVSHQDLTILIVTTNLIAAVLALLLAMEGAICILLALPLALPIALLGGVVGREAAASKKHTGSPTFCLILAIPLTAMVEPPTGRTIHEVQSSVVIDASPEAVWPHVVAFRDIPPPTDWIFRVGVAYPIRARIDGAGVGAVRYCEFSTGSFVEPIARWEPRRRLSFNVDESPDPMHELSPYRNLAPRHLHGYLRSKRGEFRFIDLGDGRTLLEGSTWYEVEMAPEPYWRVISDALIHRIHMRVLNHIKQEVEARRN